uniref:Peptidase C14 caspase domain-containing protein n=1 Tax=Chromera velia CCMP2878 TaxID=1169474 RepID=A0A0G4IAS8_9ALVE|eukprot:Cvel_12653.t1-p1 / transcript=Cvel_12653.t1 / gene=Cvel_12653 / organism=Chromera_velia_CCMP2878 / gene_product=Metacaspase-1, putative / transcript_product=Metacaspase-1, putative / location=Cvel_scaffold836:2361-8294(-) / protein_length=380 / sequence_SO=supercontig / SO=protein_coding / is_pseudo=false
MNFLSNLAQNIQKETGVDVAGLAQEALGEVLDVPSGGAQHQQEEKSDRPPFGSRALDGKRRALLVGINYIGQNPGELRGCINDVASIKGWLLQQGFSEEEMKVLTDDHAEGSPERPTGDNLRAGMRWLVENAKEGDVLFMHYSGHGGQMPDDSGDEEDGMDETLIPVDFQQKGMIRDDEVYDILVKSLPQGTRLVCLFDCCHSGTALDLPFVFKATAENCKNWWDGIPSMVQNMKWDFQNAKSLIKNGLDLGKVIMRNVQNMKKGEAEGGSDEARFERTSKVEAMCEALMISGCADHQTSADVASVKDFKLPDTCGPGGAGGACTNALLQALGEKPKEEMSFIELLDRMRKILAEKGFDQVPQLSASVQVPLDHKVSDLL